MIQVKQNRVRAPKFSKRLFVRLTTGYKANFKSAGTHVRRCAKKSCDNFAYVPESSKKGFVLVRCSYLRAPSRPSLIHLKERANGCLSIPYVDSVH